MPAKKSAAKHGSKGRSAAKMQPVVKKVGSVDSPFTKSQTLLYLAQRANLKRAEVALMMGALEELIIAHLKKQGPGMFTFPGVAKFKVVRKPATKSRKGINPFTGEPTVFKAKPARNIIKIKVLKKLKETV